MANKIVLAEVTDNFLSEITGRYALEYAKLTKASLRLCLVHEKGFDFEIAEKILERLFLEAEGLKLEVECLIKPGERYRELKEIILKERVDLAFLVANGLKNLLKLPCSLALFKFIHLGKISPRHILGLLREDQVKMEECLDFLVALSKIFEAKLYLSCIGKEEVFERVIKRLSKRDVKYEIKFFERLSHRALTFEILSKKVELLVIEPHKEGFISLFKKDPVKRLIEHPPCNMIIFRPHLSL